MAKRSNKETLRSEVIKYIIKGIGEGKYKLGERIVETKLAKELDMSQAPVREAVLELSIMGVLEERPYAGSFVRKPDRKEADDHYRVRGLIESYAASLAAPIITDEYLDEMASILERMKECTDFEDFVDLDHDFHETIINASGNRVLKRVWTSVSVYELTYQTIVLANKWTLVGLYDKHKRLYDVLKTHNGPAAEAEMFLHIDGFRTGVMETLAQAEADAVEEGQEEESA